MHMETVAENIVKRSDRLVVCISCGHWKAMREERASNCTYCGSPIIRQATHERWAKQYNRAAGVVYAAPHKIPVAAGSIVASVLVAIQKKYAAL